MSSFEWIAKSFTFIYNMVMTLLFRNGREPQLLQDRTHEEHSEKRGTWNRGGEDTVDFGVAGNLKNSLEKVSEAIYKKFVSDWHSPPEEIQNQPLYKEINSGIQSVFFNIKSRARPLEEYEILISVATGLIAHLKKQRGKEVTYRRFRSRQDEVDFVRKHIKCLLDYWLPEAMQRSPLIYVFITEILSVNVLEHIINNYSEFKFINEAIVLTFDNDPATQKNENSGRCDEMNEDSSCSASAESNTAMESDNIPRKNEKRGIKAKIKEFFKSKKRRKTEDAPSFRAYCSELNEETADGDVADMGSYDDSEDDESSEPSIIEASLTMWLQNNWTAKVSKILPEDEYEISVYDESDPDTVLWNTKRRVKDFQLIYKKLLEYPDFTKFTKPDTTGGPTSDADRQFFHSIGKTPDELINILLNLIKLCQDTEAVFFFSPFDYEDDVTKLLHSFPKSDVSDTDEENFSEPSNISDEPTGDSSNSGMDSDDPKIEFRNVKTQSEEEEHSEDSDRKSSLSDFQDTSSIDAKRSKPAKDDESMVGSCEQERDSRIQNYSNEPDGIKLRSRKKHKKDKSPPRELEDMSSTSVTRDEEFLNETADLRTDVFNIQSQPYKTRDSTGSSPQKRAPKGLDLTSQNITQTMEEQKQKLQETLLNVLYKLIQKALAGKLNVYYLHKIGFLKSYSKLILKNIPNLYAEEQIICCLNQVAELLTSQVRPLELTPDVLRSKALNHLQNKVQGFLVDYCPGTIKNHIMNNLEASHQALQHQLANKETIYGLLEDLTKIITKEVNSPTLH